MSKIIDQAKKIEQNKYSSYSKTLNTSMLLNLVGNLAFISPLSIINLIASANLYRLSKNALSNLESYSYTYDEIRKLYKEYLKNVSAFFKNTGLTDDLYYMNRVFSYMLNNGYFSCDKELTTDIRSLKYLFKHNLMGSYVTTGILYSSNAVCFFRDLLKELGIESNYINITSLIPLEDNKDEKEKNNVSSFSNILLNYYKTLNSIDRNDLVLPLDTMEIDLDVRFKDLKPVYLRHSNNHLVGVEENGEYKLFNPNLGRQFFKIDSLPENVKINPKLIERVEEMFKDNSKYGYSDIKKLIFCDESLNFSVIRNILDDVVYEDGIIDSFTSYYDEKEELISRVSSYDSKFTTLTSELLEKYQNKMNIMYAENYDLTREIKEKLLSLRRV